MKILLLGKTGQVGWELQRSLSPLGEVTALDRHSKELCGDLANLEGLLATVRQLQPDVIVNAAAYTAVDKAESDADTARLINAAAPGALAQAATAVGAWLVHYSTDYVFDGSGSKPWVEDDAKGPLSVYGQTKLDGERAISASGCRHLILRTSWVYAATLDSRMSEIALDRFAEIDFQLKTHAKQFWAFLAGLQEVRRGIREASGQSAP
jgi:dTDP-4-dehydrorhamnose reductase